MWERVVGLAWRGEIFDSRKDVYGELGGLRYWWLYRMGDGLRRMIVVGDCRLVPHVVEVVAQYAIGKGIDRLVRTYGQTDDSRCG